MAQLEEIHHSNVKRGMRIAVELRGGFAYRRRDVEEHPERYQWWTITQAYPDGTIHCREGAAGVSGQHVVVCR